MSFLNSQQSSAFSRLNAYVFIDFICYVVDSHFLPHQPPFGPNFGKIISNLYTHLYNIIAYKKPQPPLCSLQVCFSLHTYTIHIH